METGIVIVIVLAMMFVVVAVCLNGTNKQPKG